MTDRQLLEAAAKAAELPILYWAQADYPVVQNGTAAVGWNPLKFDSDALRLAVALKIDICWNENDGPGVWHLNAWPRDGFGCEEEPGTDPYAATRRAITRAASALGGAL